VVHFLHKGKIINNKSTSGCPVRTTYNYFHPHSTVVDRVRKKSCWFWFDVGFSAVTDNSGGGDSLGGRGESYVVIDIKNRTPDGES
jgi:hypothetical protein